MHHTECKCVLCVYVSLCAWTCLSCVSRFCRLTSRVHDNSRKFTLCNRVKWPQRRPITTSRPALDGACSPASSQPRHSSSFQPAVYWSADSYSDQPGAAFGLKKGSQGLQRGCKSFWSQNVMVAKFTIGIHMQRHMPQQPLSQIRSLSDIHPWHPYLSSNVPSKINLHWPQRRRERWGTLPEED